MVELLCECTSLCPISCTTKNIISSLDVRSHRCDYNINSTGIDEASLTILDGISIDVSRKGACNRSLAIGRLDKSLQGSFGSLTIYTGAYR